MKICQESHYNLQHLCSSSPGHSQNFHMGIFSLTFISSLTTLHNIIKQHKETKQKQSPFVMKLEYLFAHLSSLYLYFRP